MKLVKLDFSEIGACGHIMLHPEWPFYLNIIAFFFADYHNNLTDSLARFCFIYDHTSTTHTIYFSQTLPNEN